MSAAADLRQLARDKHEKALATANGDPSARALITAASSLTGVSCVPLNAGDPLLDGGEAQLDVDAQTIWYNADLDPLMIPFYQAHEFAHYWLGHQPSGCTLV